MTWIFTSRGLHIFFWTNASHITSHYLIWWINYYDADIHQLWTWNVFKNTASAAVITGCCIAGMLFTSHEVVTAMFIGALQRSIICSPPQPFLRWIKWTLPHWILRIRSATIFLPRCHYLAADIYLHQSVSDLCWAAIFFTNASYKPLSNLVHK